MATSRSHRRAVAVTNVRGERTVATNVPADLSVKLDELCRERGQSKSQLLRGLIEHELGEHKRCTQCGFVLDLRWVAEFPAKDFREPPCKDKSPYVRHDGGCLRCNADQGEACRDKEKR